MWTTLCHDRGMTTGFPPAGPVHRSRLRFAVMLSAGAAAAAVTALAGYWVAAPAVGWGVAALTYVAWVWLAIGRFNPAETRAHATAEDPSRGTTDLLILRPTSPASARWPPSSSIPMPAAAGPVSAGGSWRWPRSPSRGCWYRRCSCCGTPSCTTARAGKPGLGGRHRFQSGTAPAVHRLRLSRHEPRHDLPGLDTALQNHGIRAEALKHSLLSYLFGTVILATTISLVISLAF